MVVQIPREIKWKERRRRLEFGFDLRATEAILGLMAYLHTLASSSGKKEC